MTDLQSLEPDEGVEMYLEARRDELATSTIGAQEYRLEAFLQWCDESGIEDLRDLTGRELYKYRVWRREGNGEDRDPVADVTLRGQLATLRAFLGFAAEIEAVPGGLREKVPLPSTSGAAGVSDSTLEPDRTAAILDYLEQYHYAGFKHTAILLLWHTGARLGAVRGLDLRDCDLDSSRPSVEFKHRPETDTPLKNKERGERVNAVSSRVARVVRAYIDGPRDDVLDEYDREPLLTTRHGRPVVSTFRDTMYVVSRPCWIGAECPHDRDPDTCPATYTVKASTCPSSRSPHDLRSGRVTAFRRDDVPRRVVSDRLDASEDILDRHYDRRNASEKAEQRRDYLPDS